MFSSLPDLQKERGFPHPSRKKKLLQSKRESTSDDRRRARPLVNPPAVLCRITLGRKSLKGKV
jgi:hypothetical protein